MPVSDSASSILPRVAPSPEEFGPWRANIGVNVGRVSNDLGKLGGFGPPRSLRAEIPVISGARGWQGCVGNAGGCTAPQSAAQAAQMCANTIKTGAPLLSWRLINDENDTCLRPRTYCVINAGVGAREGGGRGEPSWPSPPASDPVSCGPSLLSPPVWLWRLGRPHL